MSRETAFLLSLSILIPLVAGWVRFGKIPNTYRDLVYLLTIGLANEAVCYFFFSRTSNAVPTNIYFLCEFVLLCRQFRRWGHVLVKPWQYFLLQGGMCTIWIIENLVFGRITTFSPFFQVSYSLVLILLAVNQLNWLIVNVRGSIVRNTVFLVCVAIIIFFSYKVLAEIFYYYAPENVIKNNIFGIESYINVGYNVLLAIAIICIPPRRNFIQLLQ